MKIDCEYQLMFATEEKGRDGVFKGVCDVTGFLIFESALPNDDKRLVRINPHYIAAIREAKTS